MREQQRRLVITFHTTADAMAMEQLCKAHGLSGRLIPAPRAMTADCSIAWSCPPEVRQQLMDAVQDTIEFAGCCEMMV